MIDYYSEKYTYPWYIMLSKKEMRTTNPDCGNLMKYMEYQKQK
jgi:hypothetical protein